MRLDHLAAPLAVKAVGEAGSFSGYASVFAVEDQGRDIVAADAFTRSLAEWRRRSALPKMLWQHDSREPIGVWQEMRADRHGLHVEGRLLLDVQRGREAHALLKAGALDGLSIGYETIRASLHERSGLRTLLEVALWEVSLVTFPMNPAARVAAVKAAPITTIREFEAALRDALGFSRRDARCLAAGGFRALPGRDDDGAGLEALQASLDRAARSLTIDKE